MGPVTPPLLGDLFMKIRGSGPASDVIIIEPSAKFDLVDLQPGLNPPLSLNPELESAEPNLKQEGMKSDVIVIVPQELHISGNRPGPDPVAQDDSFLLLDHFSSPPSESNVGATVVSSMISF
jgi:hypothetical protein